MTDEIDLTVYTIDLETLTLTEITLGTDGLAKGIFSAFGDMAAVTIRILLGTAPELDNNPLCILGSDLPSEYQPATPPNDITPIGTSAWGGVGEVSDFTSQNQNTYGFSCAWSNFTNDDGPGTLFFWGLTDRANNGLGNVLLNYAGTVPFGTQLAAGAFIYGNSVYAVAPS